MSKNKVKINVYGYEVATIDEATRLVCERITQLKLDFSLVSLPTKERHRSVLTSPHKHKGAQEQFKWELHKRVIHIDNVSPSDLESLEKLKVPNTAHIEVKYSEVESSL
jgi:ribosomal protein S10